MTGDLTLVPTRLRDGLWEGLLSGPPGPAPPIEARLRGQSLPELSLAEEAPGRWRVRLPVPAEAISDGVQSIAFTDPAGDRVLARLTLVMGEASEGEIWAELERLRGEIAMLARAFRRHCRETDNSRKD
ncbi:hypothetical protein [Pseudoroseicyclus aestuarii]|uniref:Uncharacterized protein n=1 Tax=Pseudoroseicyclus aestuarii TaxID=1795041 RepID=A0A318T0J7_9RHOB|nr:hypothetical protein [Pseudoroseicyclus aestuarii]PYE83694.1 hypothetical protein DFP88_10352 [Pseudoroseicyclus aestuarii]